MAPSSHKRKSRSSRHERGQSSQVPTLQASDCIVIGGSTAGLYDEWWTSDSSAAQAVYPSWTEVVDAAGLVPSTKVYEPLNSLMHTVTSELANKTQGRGLDLGTWSAVVETAAMVTQNQLKGYEKSLSRSDWQSLYNNKQWYVTLTKAPLSPEMQERYEGCFEVYMAWTAQKCPSARPGSEFIGALPEEDATYLPYSEASMISHKKK